MAMFAHLRREEKWGLGIAVAAHIALVMALLAGSWRSPPRIPPAERMTVNLSDNVSLNSTAPNPSNASQAAVAPVIAPTSAPLPAPTSVPVPAPIQPIVDRTPPKPAPAYTSAPKQTSAAKEPAKQPPKASNKSGGGSLLGPNFLKGLTSGERQNAGAPAQQAGPAVSASIVSAMIRQIRPHWRAPEGVDADKLVTYLDFDLNPDGSLNGRPRLVGQEGITPSNKPQASVHAENAIRAVILAAPFDLPEQYYDVWKHLRHVRFDRNL